MDTEFIEQEGKGIYVFVVILVLLVLGLGGFIVYDKFIRKSETKKNDTEIVEEDDNEILIATRFAKNYLKDFNNSFNTIGILNEYLKVENNKTVLNEEKILNKNIFDDATARIIFIRSNLLEVKNTSDEGFNKDAQDANFVELSTFEELYKETFSKEYSLTTDLEKVSGTTLNNKDELHFKDENNKYVSWNNTLQVPHGNGLFYKVNDCKLKGGNYLITGNAYLYLNNNTKETKNYKFSLIITGNNDNYRISELTLTK